MLFERIKLADSSAKRTAKCWWGLFGLFLLGPPCFVDVVFALATSSDFKKEWLEKTFWHVLPVYWLVRHLQCCCVQNLILLHVCNQQIGWIQQWSWVKCLSLPRFCCAGTCLHSQLAWIKKYILLGNWGLEGLLMPGSHTVNVSDMYFKH